MQLTFDKQLLHIQLNFDKQLLHIQLTFDKQLLYIQLNFMGKITQYKSADNYINAAIQTAVYHNLHSFEVYPPHFDKHFCTSIFLY